MWLSYTAITSLYSDREIRPFVCSPGQQKYAQDGINCPHAKGSGHWTQWSEHFAYSRVMINDSMGKIQRCPKKKQENEKGTEVKTISFLAAHHNSPN